MIYLREITRSDIPAINSWRNDKPTVDLLGSVFRYINIETDENWFDNYLKNRNNTVRLAVCMDGSIEIIGMVNLHHIDHLNMSAEFSLQIGNTTERGKGIGLQATKMLIHHAFYDLNLQRIYAYVLESNIASRKMFTKAGFEEEGLLKSSVYKNSKFRDQIIFALLKKDFKDTDI